MRLMTVLCCLVLSASVAPAHAQKLLDLEIGDPVLKTRRIPVVLDGITEAATGTVVAPDDMAARLADTGILFIGENHTNIDFHVVQLRAIKALHEAGREVLIGLEMFPWTSQADLDHWNAGHYTEEGFLKVADWYGNWGYNWHYYRDIFLYARQHGLRMYAVNSPREFVRDVRRNGFTGLSPEQAAHLPPEIAPASEEHQRMYRAFFDADDALHMSEAALDGLYRAQVAWDATMGWNALQALRQHGGANAIMVVLIGAGHVTYALGSERQIAGHYDGDIASLIAVPVVGDDGQQVDEVQASYASFIWGVPGEREPLYPTLGISLMGSIGKDPGQIIQVDGRSVAEAAGLRVGDVLLAVDGTAIDSEIALRRVLASYRWGDIVALEVRRDTGVATLDVPLRRRSTPPLANQAAAPAAGPAAAR